MGVGIRAIILILCSTLAYGRVRKQKGISSISDVAIVINVPRDVANNQSGQWELSKSFISTLLDRLNISSSWTRVAFVILKNKKGNKANVVDFFPVSRYFNRECLVRGIQQKLREIENADATIQRNNTIIPTKQLYANFKENGRLNAEQILITLKLQEEKLNDIESTLAKKSKRVFAIGWDVRDNGSVKKKKSRFKTFQMQSVADIERISNDITNGAGSMTSCEATDESAIVYDSCQRECLCYDGQLQNCTRVRKEFTEMTHEERRRYLKVYKTLTTNPLYKERYEHFVFMHFKYFCWGIHNMELFCPWHRWYLWQFENILREIDCRVTIPYWDWSHSAWDPWNETDIWSSHDYGLGGNGNKTKGYCVQTGMFRQGEWRTPFYEDTLDIIASAIDQTDDKISTVEPDLSYCLRRSFHGFPFPSQHIATALRMPIKKFADFELTLRHSYHDILHNIIGGTMSTHYAGETPEFWFHHSFLDKIWYGWQSKSRKHKYAYFDKLQNSKMLGSPFQLMDFIDSHRLPGCVTVRYTQFGKAFRTKRSFDDGYDGKEVDDEDRVALSYWKGILEASNKDEFPNCKRSKTEEYRSRKLSRRIFNQIHLPNWYDPNKPEKKKK